jgi:hypothetical protein
MRTRKFRHCFPATNPKRPSLSNFYYFLRGERKTLLPHPDVFANQIMQLNIYNSTFVIYSSIVQLQNIAARCFPSLHDIPLQTKFALTNTISKIFRGLQHVHFWTLIVAGMLSCRVNAQVDS